MPETINGKSALYQPKMLKAYIDTISGLCAANKDIIALDEGQIRKPSVHCPMMQAQMIGTAAGLSLTGRIPFLYTYARHATRRTFDQLFSAAYAGLNVKIIGSDPGVTASHCGGSQISFEDIGLMRLIPDATIYEASDSVMLSALLKNTAEEYGVHYIRTTREETMKIYDAQETFEKGKGKVLREGKDVTIIASGIMVAEALKAADRLSHEGIDATVIDMFSINPIDAELIIKYAKKTGAVVTAENHSIIGGLGSAVAEVLSEKCPASLKRIGVKERFGQCGQQEYLKLIYGLTFCDIVESVKSLKNHT